MNRQSDKTTALYCRLANFTEMDSLTAKHQMDQLAAYAAENGLQNPEFFCDWVLAARTQSARNISGCSERSRLEMCLTSLW